MTLGSIGQKPWKLAECRGCQAPGDFDRAHPFCSACRRDQRYQATYGITAADVDAMIEAAGGRCPLCVRETTGQQWNVDHDHSCCPGAKSCGQCVRGVLCSECNRGLGYFRDEPDLLVRAAAYLRQNAQLRPRSGAQDAKANDPRSPAR